MKLLRGAWRGALLVPSYKSARKNSCNSRGRARLRAAGVGDQSQPPRLLQIPGLPNTTEGKPGLQLSCADQYHQAPRYDALSGRHAASSGVASAKVLHLYASCDLIYVRDINAAKTRS